ncbi:MAG: fibronectin type III domain-containing protein [Clostridiales bacterium]|nr:fibronectin type III domain-containing protein [Clostridiales bacterium]
MKRRRISAAILAAVILLGIFPRQALANLQNPVTDLSVTDYSGRADNNYTVSLRWTRPLPSHIRDTNPALVDPQPGLDDLTQADNYDVYYRNATQSQKFTIPLLDAKIKGNKADILNAQYTLNLDSGSLYVFKVTPYHYHKYQMMNGSTPVQRPAPTDASIPESQALYLTDLRVTAKGSGQNMTVVWDNPTLDGKEIFTGYRISYTAGGSEILEIPKTPFIEVAASSPDLIRTREGKLQYTFQDPTLQIGKLYAVKVEPMYNGREARLQQELLINNQSYSLSYRNMAEHEYRVNDAYISPELRVSAEGQDYVRIYWDSLKSSIQNIQHLEIYTSSTEDMSNSQRVGELFGDSARDVNFWLAKRPGSIQYYQIIIYYLDSNGQTLTVKSEIAWFDPAYNDFSPYKPAVLSITDNGAAPYSMDILWQAFARPAYNETEKGYRDPQYDNQYIDRGVSYDIYVTDDIDNLNHPLFNDKIIANVQAPSLQLTPHQIGQRTLPAYGASVWEYYTKDETGAFVKQPLLDNKVYYIKIVAIRDPSGQSSQPALGAHFIWPSGPLETNPFMISSPPLRVKRNALGAEEITLDSVAIQWDMLYWEAYQDSGKGWHAKIGVDENGGLLFGQDADGLPPDKTLLLNDPQYTLSGDGIFTNGNFTGGEAAAKADLIAMGADAGAVDSLAMRLMDLSGSQFEIYTIEYTAMEANGGYEATLNYLMSADGESLWNPIQPAGDPDNHPDNHPDDHPEYTVNAQDAPQKGPLKPNTAYVIYFRPYAMVQDKKTAYFPAYVMATTLNVRSDLEIIPIVPGLEPVSQTDASVTLRWLYSPELTYELKYSAKSLDYPNSGISVSWNDIEANAIARAEDEKNYLYYTITGLFPDTPYTIWIRSAAGSLFSAWSNPITMVTDDIAAPKPPQGLGLAAQSHTDLYNEANGVLYPVLDAESMIIEWMRDALDTRESVDPSAVDNRPDNRPAAGEFLYNPEIADMIMVRFSGLTANKVYYVRAKTILTVTRDAPDSRPDDQPAGVNREYHYTVQIALAPDFLDAIELTVPPLADVSAAPFKRKESDWSKSAAFYTARSGDEFDGQANPDMYPLPERDFEILYDAAKDQLTFRFRSDQKDSGGGHDNHADQRLISQLILNQTYTYPVDWSRYFDRPVRARVLDLPYSIFRAFEERKINLQARSDDMIFTFGPGWLRTPKNLGDFGQNARVEITFTESEAEAPRLSRGETYISKPQKLSIRIVTPSRTVDIQRTAAPIQLDFKLNDPMERNFFNIGVYTAEAGSSVWRRLAAETDNPITKLRAAITETDYYTAIAAQTPVIAQYADTRLREALQRVSAKLRFTDMETVIPNAAVSANAFNQLAAALVYNRKSVAISEPLSRASFDALAKAKLLADMQQGTVSREAAIHTMVRIYELKSQRSVSGITNLEGTAYADIAQAAPEYQRSLQKAARIGFLEETYARETAGVNPKGTLLMADLIKMIDKIFLSAASMDSV